MFHQFIIILLFVYTLQPTPCPFKAPSKLHVAPVLLGGGARDLKLGNEKPNNRNLGAGVGLECGVYRAFIYSGGLTELVGRSISSYSI